MNARKIVINQPWQISPDDWALYGRLLARAATATLRPREVCVNLLGQVVFYLPRRAVAMRAQYRNLLQLMRRSPWFADTMVEMVVRRILPVLQTHLADCREAITPRVESEIGQRICVSKHEYWNRCLRFWVPASVIWRIGGEEMSHYATRR